MNTATRGAEPILTLQTPQIGKTPSAIGEQRAGISNFLNSLGRLIAHHFELIFIRRISDLMGGTDFGSIILPILGLRSYCTAALYSARNASIGERRAALIAG